MSYSYQALRPSLFTEENQRAFLKVRDHVRHLLKTAGAFTMGKAIPSGVAGDSWTQMAFVDRMVELGELVEVTRHSDVAGQFRVFVDPNDRL